MAKPSSKRTTVKAPRTPAPPAPEPKAAAETPPAEESETEDMSEQTETQAPDQAPAQAPEDEQPEQPDASVQPDDAGDNPAAPAPSAAPVEVRLGGAQGVLMRAPLAAVLEALSKDARERVDVLREAPSISDLQKRMRATDGRCAPVIFSVTEGEPPAVFDGVPAIAAAINLGFESVDVITIRSEDAGAVQSYLAQQASTKPAESEDDFYIRVHSYYDF